MKNMILRLYSSFFYHISLIKKLLISYCILIILPLLLLTVLSYSHTSRTLIEQFQYSSDQSLHQTSIYLNKIMHNITDSTEQVAFNSVLADIFQKDTSVQSTVDIYHDYLTAANLTNNALISDLLYSVEIFINGNSLYTIDESKGTEGLSFISINSGYAKELNKGLSNYYGELLWSSPHTIRNKETNKEICVITGNRYIKSSTDYANIGIISVNIRQQSLSSIIGRSAILPNSISLLFDDKGNILSISGEELFQEYSLSADLVLDTITNKQHSLHSGKKEMLLNFIPVYNSNWTLVSITPYNEMLKTSISTRNRMILIMFCISLLFILTGYLVFRLILQRLSSLTAHMREVQFDNYIPIPSDNGGDEISNLIRCYNHLLNKINDYAASQRQLGIALKNTELKVLQEQINPHFLYNTLDSLQWLAMNNDEKEISMILSLMSKYYKIGLSKGMNMISVKDAITHIEVYLKLQNFCYGNPVQVNINVDPNIYTNNYCILKLLFQPLVENAFLHGILETKTQKGSIDILGCIIDNTLCFKIIDNGIGMTPEQIDQLLNAELQHINSSHGYGIKNVIERMRLYYGENYSLSYESVPGKGTTVILQVPCLHIPKSPI